MEIGERDAADPARVVLAEAGYSKDEIEQMIADGVACEERRQGPK